MQTNYDKARAILDQNKTALLKIAEELLAREVLDAEQVRRLAAGEPLEEFKPAAASNNAEDGAREPATKERPSIVPTAAAAQQAAPRRNESLITDY